MKEARQMDFENLIKYLTQELSEKDHKDFNEQMKLDGKLKEEKAQYQNLMEKIDQAKYYDPEYINASLGVVNRKIENKPKKMWLTNWYAVAAVLLLVASFSAVLYFYKSIEYVSTKESVLINLPDNSTIKLNKNSELKFYPNFLGKRKVALKGEAYFDVERNENKPFIIIAGQTKVEVLGTSFYVSSYHPKVATYVTVTSGRVKVMGELSELGKKNIVLNKGESAVIDYLNKSIAKEAEIDQNDFVWNTGQLVYKADKLEKVLADLSKSFDLSINVQAIDISNLKFTGTFQHSSVDVILATIAQTFDMKVHYSSTDNKVLFY